MKFRMDSKQLAEAVELSVKAINPRSTLPVLCNICLIAEKNDELYLVSSDMETSMRIETRAEVIEPGGITVPAKDLLTYLKNFGAGAVIDFSVDRYKLNLKYKTTNVELDGIVAEEYPMGPVNPTCDAYWNGKISSEELLDGLEFTLPCVSTDENREDLQGPRFYLREDTFSMVAIDGFRIATWHYDKRHDDGCLQVVLPPKPADLLKRLLKGQDADISVTFRWKEPKKDTLFPYRPECSFGWVHQTRNNTFVLTLFAVPAKANPLSINQYYPVKFGPVIVADRKDLISFIKFAQPALKAGNNALMMVGDKDHVILGAKAECSSIVRREIIATCSYPKLFAWSASAKFLSAILASYQTNKVQITFPLTYNEPTIISAPEEPFRHHLLMRLYHDPVDYVTAGLCIDTPDIDVQIDLAE